MTMERRSKVGVVEVRKDADGNPTMIEGYAAVFYDGSRETEYELWPGTLERIMPGAFDDRLSDDVRGLFNHDLNWLLGRNGKTMTLSVDSRGFKYEIQCCDSRACQDVLLHLQRGDVDGSSFSFRGAKADWQWDQPIGNGEYTADIREITGFASIFDVGPVVDPAYTGTTAGARDRETVAEARASYEAAKRALVETSIRHRERLEKKLSLDVSEVT